MDSNEPPVLLRQHLLIDQSVQGSLLRRIAFYSLACSVYFMMSLVITESLSNPNEAISETTRRCMEEALFWAPGVMLLTPIIIYDLLKVANRLALPIFRLRREMQRLVDGESQEPLEFRDDDYWQEAAETFNQIRDELMELRKFQASVQLAHPSESFSPSPVRSPKGLIDQPSRGVEADEPLMTVGR